MEPVYMVVLEVSFGYEVRFRIGLMVNAEMYQFFLETATGLNFDQIND